MRIFRRGCRRMPDAIWRIQLAANRSGRLRGQMPATLLLCSDRSGGSKTVATIRCWTVRSTPLRSRRPVADMLHKQKGSLP